MKTKLTQEKLIEMRDLLIKQCPINPHIEHEFTIREYQDLLANNAAEIESLKLQIKILKRK